MAHLIGDFILQPYSWVKAKETSRLKAYQFYLHVIIHAGLILLVFWDLSFWLLALTIGGIHALIDVLKLYGQKEVNKPQWFVAD
ncbi:hypothetical protein A33Q_1299 [Indibacter alkaliphilus LW1]|uniref:DUF3307 domain-containing protein n=1 Tax=Indibacter alkaliphilus (strain CCUG 57479 / KCTC 22604 / LW1) TaxID=1189612 RepID=S2DN58_INDAL|nr:DUF3307 domain-containing protein [Indibacter alkaliphilus]EOZ98645.1 hypothetical protein A33Q_1299 [Indibacter alkaliphilus LW1]